MPYAHITGWGMSAPEKIVTNDDISKMVETSDEWIRERTGIRERHVAGEGQFSSTLGLEASINALKVANLHPRDLDLIICSTSSPEHIFPAKRVLCLLASKWVIAAAPDLPARTESHVSFTLLPTGLIHPIPVTTTRLLMYEISLWIESCHNCPPDSKVL